MFVHEEKLKRPEAEERRLRFRLRSLSSVSPLRGTMEPPVRFRSSRTSLVTRSVVGSQVTPSHEPKQGSVEFVQEKSPLEFSDIEALKASKAMESGLDEHKSVKQSKKNAENRREETKIFSANIFFLSLSRGNGRENEE
uniref:Uncharacterized protein n=1 Tax=Rhizophora mucronata TaxID=61149 RepID=A0A2P2PKN1_RHIMU